MPRDASQDGTAGSVPHMIAWVVRTGWDGEPHRKYPSSLADHKQRRNHDDSVFVGMDVHKDSISVGVLNPGHRSADVESIFNDEDSIRRLVSGRPEPTTP